MSKRARLLVTIAGAVAGVLVVLVVASIFILQSSWFANYVRDKIVSVTEESTGGKVELGSFQFDWSHMTVRIRNFVLHGTEPAGNQPLARVDLLEVRLKLLSALKKVVDVQYVGIQQPRVNLIVFPDGQTNLPEPKAKKQSSSDNSKTLETIVNLAVGEFRVDNGWLQYAQQKSAFSGQGQNLRVLLNYNPLSPSYQGSIRIDPLLITSAPNPTLGVHVNIPVYIDKNVVKLSNATFNTAQSQIALDAALRNLNAPQVDAHLKAAVSLPEMKSSFNLPIEIQSKTVPKILTADISVSTDGKTNVTKVNNAQIALGATTVTASGSTGADRNSAIQFQANFALAELAALGKISGTQVRGALQANGSAKIDAQNNYAVDGHLDSRGLSIQSGTTRLSNVGISSPFHADPFLISLDGLRLDVLGGSLAAKVFIEKLARLSVEGAVRNFSVPVLANAFTGKRLGYDGVINGSVKAQGDLKAKGTTGYAAEANLVISPGKRGVPLSGRLLANYSGARDSVDLGKSYLSMPNSRLDLTGSLNREIDLKLVSRNLNDFLPAANFGAAKPQTSLPIVLQGGTAQLAAQVKGNLSAPKITSHMTVDQFAAEQRSFDHFGLDLAASPSGAQIQNGSLTRPALSTTFDAAIGLRKWSPVPQSPLIANVALRSGDLADLLALAGESSIPATGKLAADVHINGTYGNPLGNAGLQLTDASAYQQPIDHLLVKVNLTDQLITLSQLELASAGAKINGNGTFNHPRESFSVGHLQFHLGTSNVQLSNIKPLVQQSPGVAGLIQLVADATGDLRAAGNQTEFALADINADFSAGNLRVQNQDAGDLTASARTANNAVRYNVASNFAGSNIKVSGQTALAKNYQTVADALIDNLSVEKALQIVGQGSVPARGTFSANAHVAGTVAAPNADLQFALARANVYQEPVNRLEGKVRYSNTAIDIPSILLDVPAGSVTMSGSFAHPAGDLQNGALQLKLDSTDIQVAKIQHAQQAKPGLTGTLRLAADISANVREQAGKQSVLFSRLTANATAKTLRVNQLNLGGAELDARSSGQTLNFRFDSDIAKSQIHAAGTSQLTGDYPTQATLSFANIRYANLAPFIEPDPEVKPGFDALVEGKASLNGPVLKSDDLNAKLQLSTLQLRTVPTGSVTGAPPGRSVTFQNEGAVDVTFDHSNLQLKQFHLKGPKTDVNIGGGVNLKNERAPLGITIDANADLGVLQDVSRDFYSSGALAMNAIVRGTFAQPLVNGKVELKNANVNYADAPNGLSNANGVILLNGTNATIQNLAAESGGGRVSVGGFVGYTGNAVNFNLRANADKVRVRYSGVSVTANAALALIGNTNRSLVNGTVTVQRIAYGSSSDAGSFLSSVSTPPTTPSAPSPVLSGMRLDIHILTAPDLRVMTTYADRLSVEANLSVRGTASTPGMLGRVVVTDGQLVFFGNQYTVNTGTVNFFNPTSIEPVLNVSLETIAQNVDVVLGVTGPMNNLQLSYRSDPPLTFAQIVSLLATNTTPNDPTIAARQPAPPQQSLSQMGESAVLGQAVANPLASRVQRVFGISALKIDPSFAGSNGQPSAKVTLQQKIASNITFTYITDVTQTNSQIIRLEWALTPKLSAVGLRDYNGNVSVQFFYKFKKR